MRERKLKRKNRNLRDENEELTEENTFYREEYERLTAENIYLLMETETLKQNIEYLEGEKEPNLAILEAQFLVQVKRFLMRVHIDWLSIAT